jgi:hypothetical protein
LDVPRERREREEEKRRRRRKEKGEKEEEKAEKALVREIYEAAGADWLLPKHAALRPHQAWHRGVL